MQALSAKDKESSTHKYLTLAVVLTVLDCFIFVSTCMQALSAKDKESSTLQKDLQKHQQALDECQRRLQVGLAHMSSWCTAF